MLGRTQNHKGTKSMTIGLRRAYELDLEQQQVGGLVICHRKKPILFKLWHQISKLPNAIETTIMNSIVEEVHCGLLDVSATHVRKVRREPVHLVLECGRGRQASVVLLHYPLLRWGCLIWSTRRRAITPCSTSRSATTASRSCRYGLWVLLGKTIVVRARVFLYSWEKEGLRRVA